MSKVVINNVRLSFPCLWETEKYNGTDTEKFAATFLIPKNSDALKQIKEAMATVSAEKFGKNPPKGLKLCLQDGDEKEYDGYADHMFVKATTKRRPVVVDKDRTPLVEDDGKPYAGCYVNASIDFWAMDNQYGKRILCNLNGIQFAKDGEPFGSGGNTALGDFADISDASEDAGDDPFA